MFKATMAGKLAWKTQRNQRKNGSPTGPRTASFIRNLSAFSGAERETHIFCNFCTMLETMYCKILFM